MTTKYVAYYRVSTKQQGQSGLGLDAQQIQVKNFVGENNILKHFVEVESGKNNNRPELKRAIELAKKEQAKLVIAKLDRLSRNAAFIFMLRDTNVNFVCADMPEANSLTIGIMAVLAQDERERISQRTKAALDAKKAKGINLGTPANLTLEARQKGLTTRMKNAKKNKQNIQATELIISYKKEGYSLADIATKLNDKGFKTRYGKDFKPMSVKRLYDRHNKLSAS